MNNDSNDNFDLPGVPPFLKHISKTGKPLTRESVEKPDDSETSVTGYGPMTGDADSYSYYKTGLVHSEQTEGASFDTDEPIRNRTFGMYMVKRETPPPEDKDASLGEWTLETLGIDPSKTMGIVTRTIEKEPKSVKSNERAPLASTDMVKSTIIRAIDEFGNNNTLYVREEQIAALTEISSHIKILLEERFGIRL